MIIGIDDSGDFDRGTFAYFVGVHVRATELEPVRETHRAWERKVRKQGMAKDSGEVKGNLLSDKAREAFVDDVLRRHWPWVRYSCIELSIDESAIAFAKAQRELTVHQAAAASTFYTERDGRRSKIANQYTNLSEWWSRRSNAAVLKATVLGELIGTSFAFVVPYSAAMDFDRELDQLTFKIDAGIWPNAEQTRSWKTLLGSHIWNVSRRHPVTVVDSWDADHPYYKAFVADRKGDIVMLPASFGERIGFFDSESTFEVRLADVVASVVRGRESTPRLIDYLKAMHTVPDTVATLIEFTGERALPTRNPYELFAETSGQE